MNQATEADTRSDTPRAEGQQLNRLAGSHSPYLLQHADNPVDWYPWGEAAFKKAKEEDKPIFLSIGYSTCHWCHVMEHESFEDPEVARLLNETFVCIKVDREERPDIDGVYMTVCQMMTGSGGWPLTILMTPDKKPFYAATYIPKESRFGRPGLMQLIPRIQEMWTEERGKVLDSAERITRALDQLGEQQEPSEALGEEALSRAWQQLRGRFDTQHGGFGGAPKFPTPHQLLFLLRHWRRSGDDPALRMVERTLTAMRRGGIYDHVGFGFHRYSTDARWLVPHFEKMLYDQALLTLAYTEAVQATGADLYRRTVEEVLTYVLRDMTDPAGGFYSAEDADSEGEEGKFYLWTLQEVREVLGEDADLAAKVFNVQDGGNYPAHPGGPEPGKNILHRTDSLVGLAAGLNRSEQELRQDIEAARERLFARRETRVHPGKDDKVLTDWNGLMIAALAKAGRVLDEPAYTAAASRAAAFLLENLRTEDGRLLHRWRDGQAGITAHADDYAFFVWGLIELYESTFEVEHLRTALSLTDELLEHHWDEAEGGLYFTADDAEELLVRQKEIYDGAVPSANSVAMGNFLRLARLTGRTELEERAAAMNRAFASDVQRQPVAYTQFLVALDFGVGPAREVVIAGEPEGEDTQALLRALRSHFLPRKVVLLRPAGERPAIAELAPFTEAQTPVEGQAAAYVCRNFTCERPVTTPDAMLELLEPPQTSRRKEAH